MKRTAGVVVAVLMGLAVPAAADERRGGDAYLPLGEGARWTYRFTNEATGGSVEYRYRVLREVEVAGGKCYELKCAYGRASGYEYWAGRPDGVYLYHNASLGGLRGVAPHLAPRRVLACPAGEGTAWEWEEQGSVQTMGDDPGPPREDLIIRFRAVVEVSADPVIVPSGSYEAVRVRVASESRYFGQSEETVWYAPGVGIVKRRGGPYVYELVAFTPPDPPHRGDDEAAVAALLGRDPDLAERGRPDASEALEPPVLREWFRSRFRRVLWGDAAVILRVGRGAASRFDPRDPADWRDLLAAEGIEVGAEPTGDADQAVEAIGEACAALVGASRGPGACRPPRPEDFRCELDLRTGTWTVEGRVSGETRAGRAWSEAVRLEFRHGTVFRVETREDPPK